MIEYIVTVQFSTRHGIEVEEIRAYGFLPRHAVKAVLTDNPRSVVVSIFAI